MKSAAIVYDFDGTLSPGSMQEHTFLPEIGFLDPRAFWLKVKAETAQRDGDEILVYMHMMLSCAPRPITKALLAEHGRRLPLFSGVDGWFRRMNEYAAARRIELKHYIVSSGLKEMIEPHAVSTNFSAIYASSFAYDDKGIAVWPSMAINYTTKTQFLFRINKGIENSWDNVAVNRWQPMNERPVPFSRMIFVGDGDTDIPAMKMVRYQGGFAVAVFDPDRWSEANSQDKIHTLISEDRANYIAPADYSAGSQLDVTIRGIIGRIARDSGYRPPQAAVG